MPDASSGESDQPYRILFEHAPDALLVVDRDSGNFVDANPSACRLLGLSYDQLLASTSVDVSAEIQPDGRTSGEAAIEYIDAALAGSCPTFEWLFKDSAGEEIICEVRVVRMPPYSRRLVLGTITDIRERKAIETAAIRREREFRTLAENSPDWIVRVDRDLRRTFVNRAVVEASGTDISQLLGRRPTETFPESTDLQDWEAALQRALETGEPEVLEVGSNLGRTRYLQTSIVPERDEAGRIESVLSITRDVTSVRRAIAAEGRLAAIVESANDAIMSSDRDGVILTWNRGAERLFGYSAAEAVGKTTEFLFAPTGSAARDTLRTRVFAGEVIEGFVSNWPRKDGSRVSTSSAFFPLRDATGEIVGMASVARDITEEQAMLDAVKASEERYREALVAASMATWSWDSQSGVLQFSEEAASLFSRTVEDLPAKTGDLLRILHPDDAIVLRQRITSGDLNHRLNEYRIRLPDGTYRWIGLLARSNPESPTGVTGLIQDIHERKLAELGLRESEERFRLLADSAPVMIWLADTDKKCTYFNQGWLNFTGRTLEQEAGDDWQSGVHPDDLTECLEVYYASFERREPFTQRYRLLRHDGEYRWLLDHGQPRFATDGSFLGYIGSCIEIHDSVLAEEALRISEARFREVVEKVSAGIWVFDGEDVVMVNPQLERMTGYSGEMLTRRGFMNGVLDPDDAKSMLERGRARVAGDDPPGAYEVRITRADGERRSLEISAARIEFRGQPASLVSAFDVTERRLAEDELRRSEERFRSLVDNSPDYITRIDADLRHVFVNRTATERAGLDPESIIGLRADELPGYPPELARQWLAYHTQVRDTGEPFEFEYELPGRLGPVYRRCRLIPEKDADGTVHHILCLVTDITAQKRAEEERRRLDAQMQHAQKLESLGVLAGGIAHDFNNLLVAILGNAGLALLELPPESPARQTVLAIETASQRAAELTRQMLAYSGKGKFIIEPLSLSRLVEEMAHLLEVSVSKSAVLKYRFAPNLPPVEGDATQVRQVIMNLITNASDAIGERSGVISITTGMLWADHEYLAGAYLDGDLPEGDYAFIEVADTGEGMDAETQSRIFDPFFTTKFTGRGLGLAAVLGIVRGHRGAVKIYSEVGRGTTFKVLFPVLAVGPSAAEKAASLESRGTSEERANGRKILVVDDDDTVRAVTRRILERSGFEVLLAVDGADGVETYRANPGIDLVLLDMTMPRMDGEETFRELRRVDPDVRVILTSGYNEQDATDRFAGKGLAGFIQKPYRPQELMERIFATLSS